MNANLKNPACRAVVCRLLFWIIIISLLNVVIVNCSRSIDSGAGGTPVIFDQPMPLEIGNTWVYERIRFGEYDTAIYRYDTLVHDTIHISVDRYTPHAGGWWAVLDGQPFDELWCNRDDGTWVKRDGGDAFLLFKSPYKGFDEWSGDGGRYEINTLFQNCFYTVPEKGDFPMDDYHCYDNLLSKFQHYFFCPGIGIVRLNTWVESETGSIRRFEELRLINFAIKDPPVDSTGRITFHLRVDDNDLPPDNRFSIRIGLNYVTPICRNYSFTPDWGVEAWPSCFCPMIIDCLDSLANYTFYIKIPFVPPGERTMIVEIESATSSSADTVDLVVDSSQTVYLGTLTPLE